MSKHAITLDLKKFKHIKSDDNSTTLQHADGHQLVLAHKALNPANQKQLAALSAMNKNQQEPDMRGEAKADQQQGLAKGGEVQRFASKGIVNGNHETRYAEGMTDPGNLSMMDTLKQGWSNVQRELTPSPTPAAAPVPTPAPAPVPTPVPAPRPTEDWNHVSGVVPGYDIPQAKAKGGMVQHYAEGEQVMEANPDVVARQEQAAQDQQQQADAKAAQQHKLDPVKAYYNEILPSSGLPTGPDTQFGPNGELPKNPVNPDLWNRAQQHLQYVSGQNASYAAQQQNAEHVKAQAQNAVNTQLGSPLEPDPGAPQPSKQPTQAPTGNTLPSVPNDQVPVVPKLGGQGPATTDMQGAAGKPGANSLAYNSNDPEAMLKGGYGAAQAGIGAGATAIGERGAEEAGVLKTQIDAQQQAQNAYQSMYTHLEGERQNHMDDIKNGYIDPNQYWTGVKNPETGEMEGGHSKMASAIGLILGGLGAQGTGGVNQVAQMLQFNIDKSMDAQAKNLNAKDNLLAHNIQQFGNLKEGAMMTRIIMQDALQAQIAKAAATASGPIAQAAAQEAQGKLAADTAQQAISFSLMRGMNALSSSGNAAPGALEHMLNYARIKAPDLAKSMESRIVPGLGPNGGSAMSPDIAVPQEVRDKLVGFQNTSMLIKDLQDFTKNNSTIIPGTPSYNVGAQKALLLQSAIREGQLGTVYKQGEQPLLDKFVSSNPAGALKMLQTEPQLMNLFSTNMKQFNILKAAYKLPQTPVTSGGGDSQSAALAWAKANPGPKADKILQVLGKK